MGSRTGPRRPSGGAFTETTRQHERRLARDRVLSTAAMVVFGATLLVNLWMEFDSSVVLLPGGHSEFYFLLSLAGIAWGGWVRFDLGLDRRKRR